METDNAKVMHQNNNSKQLVYVGLEIHSIYNIGALDVFVYSGRTDFVLL